MWHRSREISDLLWKAVPEETPELKFSLLLKDQDASLPQVWHRAPKMKIRIIANNKILFAYRLLSIILHLLYGAIHLFSLDKKLYLNLIFTAEETKAQRGSLTCPRRTSC